MSITYRPVLFVCLGLFGATSARGGEKSKRHFEVEAKYDLVYRDDAKSDPVKHKLDLFLPKGEKNFPVVMYLHGGRWQAGDKEHFRMVGELFARKGIGTAVVNYRLTTGDKPARHPDHIEDVARAFAWLHANVQEYGGRKDRLFVCGHSAGGHLAALLATDEKYLEAEELSPKDIRGVIPISGVFNVNPIHDLFHPVFGAGRRRPSYTSRRTCRRS
jgi:acetyl esterase/lipase